MTNSTIKTWRERIGAGADFPLHAPTDVERAMEAEIAELRAQLELDAQDDGWEDCYHCFGTGVQDGEECRHCDSLGRRMVDIEGGAS